MLTAIGKLKIDLQKLPIDLMSISGHKIYAPKGIGALIIHKNILPLLSGQIQGGDQEFSLRAGTLPSQQIIALSKACEIADYEMDYNNQKIHELSEIFLQGVTRIPYTLIHAHHEKKVPHTISLSFDCVNSRILQNMIADQIAVSLGSACNSESLEPSYVLRSMGLPQDVTSNAIRISFGKYTTKDEVLTSLQVLHNSVNLIRKQSKIWNLKSHQN